MKISIITVVLNDLENLKITYESVKKQIYSDFEYLVMDGCSNDGTIEYLELISIEDNRVIYYSEKDNGIYDAMNKAVSKASGEYIVFLGAGDKFYSDETLAYVSHFLTEDIVYGYGIFSSGPNKGKRIGDTIGLRFLLFNKVVAHQAVYSKRDLLLQYPFDTSIKVQADQDFVIHMRAINKSFKYLNHPLCFYDGYGFSANPNHRKQTRIDRLMMLKKYYLVLYYLMKIPTILINELI